MKRKIDKTAEKDVGSRRQTDASRPGSREAIHYVAIGASAGGLEAIEAFFTNMPADSGLAFVVVQHLSPDYKSLMVELLSKKTKMQVNRAENAMDVLPNNVYLIPPKKNLTIFHGKLLLSEQDHSRGVNLPIDVFLRSLSEDQGDRAIAIILSGTGSDGTRGVRAVKENGGMVMVQSEESAKFNGMPRAAIGTGLADFVLAPEKMPAQLLSYVKFPFQAKSERSESVLSNEDDLTRIFAMLREKSKVDFTYYKPSTVERRIERRMTITQTDNLKDYATYLKTYPAEVTALFRELLIGVTSFFRDQNAFDFLAEQVLPDLVTVARKREIRFWVAGCSTGEEAYSLAILVRESMEKIGVNHDVKIFATDIDQDAIHFAASGSYPESITADISTRLLAKYFSKRDDNFQIARSIREMVVFAQHNLFKDPPFTNIDLIGCRNLLIYLQPVLQHKVLEFFNFSLVPNGVLFLGSSETTGELSESFEALDIKHKIYRCRGRARAITDHLRLPSVTDTRFRDMRGHFSSLRRAVRPSEEDRVIERFMAVVVGDFFPLALIVNAQLEVLHVLGDTEGYLKVPSGAVVNDLSKMTVKELTTPLTTGIQKVLRNREEIKFTNVRIGGARGGRVADIRIRMLPDRKDHEPLVAVFIADSKRSDALETPTPFQSYDLSCETEERLRDLEQELQFTRENLQATIEELETSNEELQATNEELLASNEELQSTNEELQSTNEELFTVNAEYQNKIIELTELHNDVGNLLSAAQISQLILDENLEIRRFSPSITSIFKMLDSDIGRPITHLPHFLEDVDPIALVREVQRAGLPQEREVRSQSGGWHLMRIVPYAIGPKSYSGTVISFVEITALKNAEDEVRRESEKHRFLYENMAQGVVYQSASGEITSANSAAQRILGLNLEQMQGRTSLDPRWRTVREDGSDFPGAEHPAMIALRAGTPQLNRVMGVFNPVIDDYTWINVSAVPQFRPGEQKPYQVFATFDDITGLRKAEFALGKASAGATTTTEDDREARG